MKEKRPLRPFVSKEQLMSFDSNRAETFTESRLVNEVLLALHKLGGHSSSDVAKYLDVDLHLLSAALKVETGMNMTELRVFLCHCKVEKILATHRGLNPDEVAVAAGYCNRASIFKLLGRKRYDELLAKYVVRN